MFFLLIGAMNCFIFSFRATWLYKLQGTIRWNLQFVDHITSYRRWFSSLVPGCSWRPPLRGKSCWAPLRKLFFFFLCVNFLRKRLTCSCPIRIWRIRTQFVGNSDHFEDNRNSNSNKIQNSVSALSLDIFKLVIWTYMRDEVWLVTQICNSCVPIFVAKMEWTSGGLKISCQYEYGTSCCRGGNVFSESCTAVHLSPTILWVVYCMSTLSNRCD